MRCPVCDAEVVLGEERCSHCKTSLSRLAGSPDLPASTADQTIYSRPVFSAPLPRGPSRPDGLPWSVHEDKKPKSALSLIAGILILVGGLITLVQGALYLMVASMASQYLGAPGVGVATSIAVCGVIYLFFGFMAAMGGVLGIKRRRWELVILGAIFSMISVGALLLSSIMGLVGLILAAITRDEFD